MAKVKKNKLEDAVEKENTSEQAGEYEVTVGDITSDKAKGRRKSYRMDLRIHSPSSLGYLGIKGIDTAPALVRLAKVKGLDVIAVTDFYSGDYIDRLVQASVGSPVTVLPGLIVRTQLPVCDDIVLMCLFPEGFSTAQVNGVLKELNVPASAKGDSKFIVPLEFDKVLKILESKNGIIVPSRMDKTPYQREAIPTLVEEYGFRAFDLAYHPESIEFFKARWPKQKFQLLSFSNANALAQVGSRVSKVLLETPGHQGLKTIVDRSQLV
jgi:hypothetical protein